MKEAFMEDLGGQSVAWRPTPDMGRSHLGSEQRSLPVNAVASKRWVRRWVIDASGYAKFRLERLEALDVFGGIVGFQHR